MTFLEALQYAQESARASGGDVHVFIPVEWGRGAVFDGHVHRAFVCTEGHAWPGPGTPTVVIHLGSIKHEARVDTCYYCPHCGVSSMEQGEA